MIPAALAFLWLSSGLAGTLAALLRRHGNLTVRCVLEAVVLAPLGPVTLLFAVAHVIDTAPAAWLNRRVVDVRERRAP